MSSITLADLEYISREDLASQLVDASITTPTQQTPPHLAIIDVRDSDHVGGHIRGSTWVPSSELDYKTAELVRSMKDKETVVFHCALSQQRGPSAALRYLRERERLIDGAGAKSESKGEVKEEGVGARSGEEGEKSDGGEGNKKQKVVVLRGGFTQWQEKYGEDEKLTEGYQKDVWEFEN